MPRPSPRLAGRPHRPATPATPLPFLRTIRASSATHRIAAAPAGATLTGAAREMMVGAEPSSSHEATGGDILRFAIGSSRVFPKGVCWRRAFRWAIERARGDRVCETAGEGVVSALNLPTGRRPQGAGVSVVAERQRLQYQTLGLALCGIRPTHVSIELGEMRGNESCPQSDPSPSPSSSSSPQASSSSSSVDDSGSRLATHSGSAPPAAVLLPLVIRETDLTEPWLCNSRWVSVNPASQQLGEARQS